MTSVSYDVLRDRLTVLPTPQLSQNVTCLGLNNLNRNMSEDTEDCLV